ncbi:hypothetical protein MRB53_030875 [Persea americana]|uniref:Uncharacterized protein n=1 Tax=Persea americana TaxID=3435 RepID=A0ACC2KME5_PERAE|nr:hypothetical protein MRB53_030875 [Persea americana]
MAVLEGSHSEILIRERRLMLDLGNWEAIVDCVNSNPTVARIGVLPAEEDCRQSFISFLKYGHMMGYCSDVSPARKEKGC